MGHSPATYHPDPVIAAEVRADVIAGELVDLSIGYPPSRWTCECGASHGSTDNRCLSCGYLGPAGVIEAA